MWKQFNACCALFVLLGCAVDMDANRPIQDAERPKLLAQRVTATVKRDAATLVRIETEREAFLTTPEHPFATPRSGWIAAGQLVPGDRVVSARFGSVRVVSLHSETPSQPVSVFNLTVNPSHAYLVGTDQVLVHNVTCNDPDPTQAPATENAAARHARELEELERKIAELERDLKAALTQDKAEIKKKLDALKKQRRTVKQRIRSLTNFEKKRPREHEQRLEQRLQHAEEVHESLRRDLEATQRALRELHAQTPRSAAENEALLKLEAELQKRRSEQEIDLASAAQILTWETELAKLERSKRSGDSDLNPEQRISELKAKITAENTKRSKRNYQRRRREDPEYREAQSREQQARLRRGPYVTDSQRARDPLERMEEELVTLREQPASASRDQRIAYLTEAVQTLNALAKIYREQANGAKALARERARRKGLANQGEDTTAIDQNIARLMKEQEARKAERIKLRSQALLLGLTEARRKGPQSMDEARLRAFEQELAEPTTIDEQRLGAIERELAEILRGESDTLDAEFFDQIWREAEAEDAALQGTQHGTAEDVDAPPRAPEPPPRKTPAHEGATAVDSGFRALQNELRALRNAFEQQDMVLANQYAAESQMLPRPGSSRHAEAVQRLSALQAARLKLRTDWRQQMQNRLDVAHQQLRTMQSIERFRDEATEADLARQIVLLEHEVQHPSF